MNISKIATKFTGAVSGAHIKKAGLTLPAITKPAKPVFNKIMDAFSAQNLALINKKSEVQEVGQDVLAQIEKLKKVCSGITEENFVLNDGSSVLFKVFQGTGGGSNKGFYVLNNETGELFYAKFGKQSQYSSCSQSQTEVFSSKVYKALGLDVPDMQLIKNSDGEIGLLSKYIPGLEPVSAPQTAICEGFGADVFLANWDAVCSDNLQTNGQKLFRIDFGGTLAYRAMGGEKEFLAAADEITSLLDPKINHVSVHLYSKMTREELIKSLQRVVNLDNQTLKKMAHECGIDNYQYKTLLRRKEFLEYALETIQNTPKGDNTMFEYLQAVKKHILETPLTEFETFRKRHPEVSVSSRLRRNVQDVRETLESKRGYSDVTADMLAQRKDIVLPDTKRTAESVLLQIKDMYGSMNTQLRQGETQKYSIELLDNIISQSTIPRNITLYRGASPYDFSSQFTSYNLGSSYFLDNMYEDGKYFRIPIFPNTTLDKKVGERFAAHGDEDKILFKINAPKGTPGVYTECLEGSVIKENEQEVILARDLVYKFKRRIPFFNHNIVEIDVVKNPPKGAVIHDFGKEAQYLIDC